ncbi:MAG: hypothetical protein JWN69_1248, partial [Alphaproteobacteria bacterium]|nr:hypothetical protein [Alphaproteobacteria bacterium]
MVKHSRKTHISRRHMLVAALIVAVA